MTLVDRFITKLGSMAVNSPNDFREAMTEILGELPVNSLSAVSNGYVCCQHRVASGDYEAQYSLGADELVAYVVCDECECEGHLVVQDAARRVEWD